MESAHYFSAQPAGPFTRKPLTVDLAGETRQLQTSSGIFSPDGIDKGTAVLLADVPAPAPQGNLLDIGCGWGPIALTMALRAPHAQVYAVDVNERCVTLTNENAALLGLGNVTASTPDAVDPELRFDTIWSNPPIRIGKDELHALLLPVASAAGAGRLGVAGGAEEPRLGFAAALARGGARQQLHGDPREHLEVVPDPSGQESVPLATITAGPLSSTCSWPSGAEEELHADDAAGDVDVPHVRGALAGPVADRDGGGAGAGAAGLGLPDSALVDAHGDGSDAVVDQRFGRHNELDVGAVRRRRVHVGCREQLRGLQLGQFGQRHDGVRVAHADGQGGPCDFEPRRR